MATEVLFLAGGAEYTLLVDYIASDGVATYKGVCAFCAGDPCAEFSPELAPISIYFKDNTWAETCPFCQGRPS